MSTGCADVCDALVERLSELGIELPGEETWESEEHERLLAEFASCHVLRSLDVNPEESFPERTLSGASAARGRNGWFTPRRVTLMHLSDQPVVLDLWSGRAGENPPVSLQLALPDAELLAKMLLLGVERAKARAVEAMAKRREPVKST